MRSAPKPSDLSPSDDEDDEICPLCCETLDVTDKNFFPCPCGYQVCLYCWNHIKSNLNGLCPACRTPYRDNPHDFAPVDREELIRKKQEMKEKKRKERLERKERAKETTHEEAKALVAAHTGDRSGLRNQRVVQRNLVYVIGLAPSIASEETLKRGEYFGQYGKIVKIAVNRTPPQGGDPKLAASAYVTFAHKEDALAAIHAVDNFQFDGRLIRASFGTTKYCNTYIRGGTCTNPECLFLHEPGPRDDTVTKEEIQAWQTKGLPGSVDPTQKVIVGMGGPSGTGRRPAHPIFPPPRFNPSASRSALGGTIKAGQGGAAWQTLPPPPPITTPGRAVSLGSERDLPTAGFSPLPSTKDAPAPPGIARAHSTSSTAASPLAMSSSSPSSSSAAAPTSTGSSTANGPTSSKASPPVVVTGGGGGGRKAGGTAAVGPSGSNSTSSTTPLKAPPGMESMLVGGGGGSAATSASPSTRAGPTPTKAKTPSGAVAEAPSTPHRVPPPPGVTLDSLLSTPTLVPGSNSPLIPSSMRTPYAPPPTAEPSTSPWAPPPSTDMFSANSLLNSQESLLHASSFPPLSATTGSSSSSNNSGGGTARGEAGGGGSSAAVAGGSGGGGGGSRSSTSTDRGGTSTHSSSNGGGGGGSSSLFSGSSPMLEPQQPPSSKVVGVVGGGTAAAPGPPLPLSNTSPFLGVPSPPPPAVTPPPAQSNDSGSILMGTGGLFSSIWATTDANTPTTVPSAGTGSFPSWEPPLTPSQSSTTTAATQHTQPEANGFGGSSLFNFQLLPTADAGERSATAAADADPYRLSESLARAIGMTLPDAPDSLAAQAARGRYGKSSASRYSFANEDSADGGGDGGFGGGGHLGGLPRGGMAQQQPRQQQQQAPPPRPAHKQAPPLSGLGPQPPTFPSALTGASGLLGRGGPFAVPPTAAPPTAGRALDPSLQSGMAMLQQLLPNVNLTYGEALPEDNWSYHHATAGTSGYGSVTADGSAGGAGGGRGAGGGSANPASSMWSTQLRTSYPL